MQRFVNIVFLLISLAGVSQNNALFDQGKEHYKNGKYQDAVTTWSKIIDSGAHSSQLYFNLGNAHYKLNNVGPSIYYYEKALRLDPNDSDIKNNLAFAENARIDAIEPLPKTVFSKWYRSIAGIFTYDGWAKLAVGGSVLFMILFLLYWFSLMERRKRFFFTTSLISFLVLIVAVVLAFKTYQDTLNDRPAIIFVESTDVKNEPTMAGQAAFVLHEGTKVQILSEEENWIRIALANGKDGWIPRSDVKEL